jgi:hypothetical protein
MAEGSGDRSLGDNQEIFLPPVVDRDLLTSFVHYTDFEPPLVRIAALHQAFLRAIGHYAVRHQRLSAIAVLCAQEPTEN